MEEYVLVVVKRNHCSYRLTTSRETENNIFVIMELEERGQIHIAGCVRMDSQRDFKSYALTAI
jgi:hypothetical protein